MTENGKSLDVGRIYVSALGSELGLNAPFCYDPQLLTQPLFDWSMELYDAPILRYMYHNFRPRRHLEFGTWQGFGACLCLEECDATVWTINLWEGETRDDGSWGYGERSQSRDELRLTEVARFYDSEGLPNNLDIAYVRTDAQGFVGRLYREKGFGRRVCQIYCDSRMWDTGNFPCDFFDSALVDGGHTVDVVVSDTRKALQVLRPGGMIIWHDFCPVASVMEACETPRNVYAAITEVLPELRPQLAKLFWIEPSWLLVGLKAEK